MTIISLIFLFVYLFGAYAYGSATVYGFREVGPIWGGKSRTYPPGVRRRIDRANLALFALSTVWFALNVLVEFQRFVAHSGDSWIDFGTLLVYLFPPAIMRTLYLESMCSDGSDESAPPQIYKWLLYAMTVVSPAIGLYVMAVALGRAPFPEPFGMYMGMSIGTLFTLTSLYSTALMTRVRKRVRTAEQRRLRVVMVSMFAALSVIFVALVFMSERVLIAVTLEGIARTSPIYFMIASIYFENRFQFYDLIIKRALLMLLTVIVLGVFLALALPWLRMLPATGAQPWLFAAALAPMAMVMPWLFARTERWLDKMWLGREFTPVDAMKHVIAAMQPATDERTLADAAQARLSEIFGAPIVVLWGDQAIDAPIEHDVALISPVSGERLRIVVTRAPGARNMLSEDLALLRSLGGVLGFMLENIRLQRKRQEQDQLAQELRLQSSKSELKALRAQINPHFLFNALNAIASLIHTDPARADEAVEQLAEVFRYTLRRSDSEWAPLDQELTFARAYLDVEQARFGQRLTATITSDHLAPTPLVPSMLLQTLLENAVKHGVSQERGPGRIEVTVRTTAEQITIEVRNTGPTLSRDPSTHSTRNSAASGAVARSGRDGEGFGLRSVRERLQGHFGDRASFTLSRDEAAGMTVARITMPHVKVAA